MRLTQFPLKEQTMSVNVSEENKLSGSYFHWAQIATLLKSHSIAPLQGDKSGQEVQYENLVYYMT